MASKMPASHASEKDIEAAPGDFFDNHVVQTFSWSDVNVDVPDRATKQAKRILNSCSGIVEAGQVLALMGPSGSGKTTLLNVLSHRSRLPWSGQVLANGKPTSVTSLRRFSAFVEQEDAMIGSLTVEETVKISAKLALARVGKQARERITQALIKAFGLVGQANTIIGTPIRKGISGGQKRRLSCASALITAPNVLFLDEPTSGLDSAASYEVMKFISRFAKQHRIIVIVSIHQPSTLTFELFDGLCLLSEGSVCYHGSTKDVSDYFSTIAPIPLHMNPAEFLLDLVNTDFRKSTGDVDGFDVPALERQDVNAIITAWKGSSQRKALSERLLIQGQDIIIPAQSNSSQFNAIWVLLQRSWIKSLRDILPYGTRIAMYTGLAIMMGTVWLRLPYTQSSIQPFVTGLFFSGAFMSFMAVAYVPSIIEDLQTLRKESANGLYGPMSFIVANTIIGMPWLLLITLIFSVITYWLCNFRPTADGFWLWVLWLYLDLLAAEGLVVLLSSIFPIFVVSLAATAFANGLWMSVGGFLVPLGTLNVFWKYVFHYIDYQAYVFQAMMVNQFKRTIYDCDRLATGYYCMYPSDLQNRGQIRGTAVLDAYHYSHETHKTWEWFGIMLAIIVVYRLLGYVVLKLKSRKL